MIVTERDKIASKSLIEILNKAKFELVGAEALVVGKVMEWAVELNKRITNDLSPQIIPQSVQSSVVAEEPKKKGKK